MSEFVEYSVRMMYEGLEEGSLSSNDILEIMSFLVSDPEDSNYEVMSIFADKGLLKPKSEVLKDSLEELSVEYSKGNIPQTYVPDLEDESSLHDPSSWDINAHYSPGDSIFWIIKFSGDEKFGQIRRIDGSYIDLVGGGCVNIYDIKFITKVREKVNYHKNPRTGSYTIHVPKDTKTGGFKARD